jgi:hypothetical protein
VNTVLDQVDAISTEEVNEFARDVLGKDTVKVEIVAA